MKTVWLFLLLCVCAFTSVSRASAKICTVTTSLTNGETISLPTTVTVQTVCPAATPFFNRIYFGKRTFDFQGGSFALPVMPNGSYEVGVIAWDPTGLIKLGTSTQITVQVANGAAIPSPTPTPTPVVSATPTPSASPTPSSGVQPLGVVAPSGKHWVVVADDEFNQDTSIDSTLWNGGTGGGFVDTFCSESDPTTSLGFTGDDCADFFGDFPNAPYETIVNATGLEIQATHGTPGDTSYAGNQMADLQSINKITIHPGDYVEWSAKEPTDVSGEGDGWHTDLWCTVPGRTDVSTYGDEIDVAEAVLSTTNTTLMGYAIFGDSNGSPYPSGLVENGTFDVPSGISSGFHTYGMFWSNTGENGSVQIFLDGAPVTSLIALPSTDKNWSNGAFCFAGWMQADINQPFDGGVIVDGSTSNDDPLIIQHFRVWQAQ